MVGDGTSSVSMHFHLLLRSIGALALCISLLSLPMPSDAASVRSGSGSASLSDAVDYVRSRGLLLPMDDNQFHEEKILTRIDLVRAIVQDVYTEDDTSHCFGKISADGSSDFRLLFTDVPLSAPFAPQVCIGMFAGILSGRPDDSFKPMASANLVETAKMITKAYDIAPAPSLRLQPTVPWHEPYWYALAVRKAIPDTVTVRDQPLRRGEFAEILYSIRGERPGVHGPTRPKGQWRAQADPTPIVSTSAVVPIRNIPVDRVSGTSSNLQTQARRIFADASKRREVF